MCAWKYSQLKTTRFSILLFFFLLANSLKAEELQMSISYLGLDVVNVVLTDDGRILKVTAKATFLASIAAGMDNSYIAEYVDDYLPVRRNKTIIQKDYEENRTILYDRDNDLAVRTSHLSSDRSKTYPIYKDTRDFFTALFYIRTHLDTPKRLYLDANGLIWSADYTIVGIEKINSVLGKVDAIKVEVDFKKISPENKERSDMLTNNLVNESKKLVLWFSSDSRHLPLKTRYQRKPFPVYWLLQSYE
ncbi:MAG: DUF3108 domain-containing protein [Candidatus Cloacimonetes bacterium]|nr:DUF3108 domain-containing protein [Candidatus Cloacimonadota bacterium]